MSRALIAITAVGCLLLAACGDDTDTDSGATSTDAPANDGGQQEASGEPLRIAYISNLSGPVGEFHSPPLEGMEAYFDYLNESGGVGGRPIEIEGVDTATEVPRALAAMEEFAEDEDVLLLAGLGLSSQIGAMLEGISELEIPALSVPSSFPEGESEWYFNAGEVYEANTTAGVSYILEQDDAPQIGYVSFDSPATRGVLETSRSLLEGTDGSVVAEEFLPAELTDAAQAVTSLIDSGSDWIVVGAATDPQFQSIVQNAKVQAYEGKLLVLAGGGQDANFESADNEDYLGMRPFHAPSEEDVPAIAEMVEAAGDPPNRTEFTQGWLAGQLVASAFEECGTDCTRAGLRDALENTMIEGSELAAGPFGFSAECHDAIRQSFLYGWDGGAPTLVEELSLYEDGPCAA